MRIAMNLNKYNGLYLVKSINYLMAVSRMTILLEGRQVKILDSIIGLHIMYDNAQLHKGLLNVLLIPYN